MPTTVNGIKQLPLAGKSFLASFTDPNFKGRNEQYFEILSNRSIYENGWKANAQHTLPWRQDLAPGNWNKDKWELYNLSSDFTEADDLAGKMPAKLEEMKKKFDSAAKKYHVYPLDDRGAARLIEPKPPLPGSDPAAKRFTFYAGATRLAESAAPPIKNRSWTITAKIGADGPQTNGVLMAFGGVSAGLTLYLKDGVPTFDYNCFGEHTVVKAPQALASGDATIEVDFAYEGGGVGKGGDVTLKVNGQKVAEGKMKATVAARFGIDTFGIGEDSGQPVTFDYTPPFKFNNRIDSVSFDLR